MLSDSEALFKKLQPGPGLPSGQVVANQRSRLCGAMLELVAEHGFHNVTVRRLTALAGVSTRAFYECFANTEECFGATYSRVVRDILAGAGATNLDTEDAVRRCSRDLLTSLADGPRPARLVLVESQFVGPTARKVSRGAVSAFERLIMEAFAIEPDPVVPPPRVVRAVAAAAVWIARSRLGGPENEIGPTADRFSDWLLALRDRRLERLPVTGRAAGRPAPLGSPLLSEAIGEDRRFLLTAAAKLGVAEGYGSLTVPRIRREAGVSRRSFDAHFRGVADCFLEAVEARTTTAVEDAESKARRAGSWERALVRIVSSLCAAVARDPGFARLAFREILAPGREGLAKSEEMVAYWANRLHTTAPARGRPDPFFAEASVAAIWSMAQCEVLSGRGASIGETVSEMAFILLAPIVGTGAADHAIRLELGASSPGR